MIRGWVRKEIYSRKALALDLQQDDILIRRRLRHKMKCLIEYVVARALSGIDAALA